MRLADDSEAEIERYRDQGELFGHLGPGDQPRGMVLSIPTERPGQVELVSVAIDEALQGTGLGRRLVEEVLARLSRGGVSRVLVATASSGTGVLRFYQRLGFRMLRIERDAFGPARGYPEGLEEDGIEVRDRVWLDRWLTSPT